MAVKTHPLDGSHRIGTHVKKLGLTFLALKTCGLRNTQQPRVSFLHSHVPVILAWLIFAPGNGFPTPVGYNRYFCFSGSEKGEKKRMEALKRPTSLQTSKRLFLDAFHLSLRIKEVSFSSCTQVGFSRQLLFACQAKSAEAGVDASLSFTTIPSCLLAAEREEAKAVLQLFLKKQGLSNAVAARSINKSDHFIDHLISKLHSIYKSRYLVGRELTTLEIREALVPYLESLLEEHGDILVGVVENFPDPPGKGQPVQPSPNSASLSSPDPPGKGQPVQLSPNSASLSSPDPPGKGQPVQPSPNSASLSSKKLKAITRVSELGSNGELPAHVSYLLNLGMDLKQIKDITRRFPAFAYYSLEGKVKPVVELFLDLGVPKSDIPSILHKRPQLCGISLSGNLKPTMIFLENLGVDKSQWAKVIYRLPALLTYSQQKVTASVDFFHELGLCSKSIGKILTRCPHIISYSVEDKLRPTAEYFRMLGVDVAVLLSRCPQTFGLSLEANLKPVTEFFLERGYNVEDVSTMASRYGALYTFSLTENLIPKWEYFLTMDYPNSELVKFPQYFGYSLEERIKPRYARVEESGVRLLLNQVLSVSDSKFEKILMSKAKKMFD